VQFNLEQYIDPAATAVGLTIPEQSRDSLRASMQLLAAMAEQVMDFPLGAETESAQEFKP
jgi:hypothetical protein